MSIYFIDTRRKKTLIFIKFQGFLAGPGNMPEYMTSFPMTSLTLDAIACKEEDAVVVEYILKGQLDYP